MTPGGGHRGPTLVIGGGTSSRRQAGGQGPTRSLTTGPTGSPRRPSQVRPRRTPTTATGFTSSAQVGTNSPTRYVSDVDSGLPVILDDGARKYVWGLGLAYGVNGSSLEVYHADRLGSVRELTDATGAVIATYRTDEWGIPTQVTGTSGQPFRFTGEPFDGTGLLHLRARYYDPGHGRFMSRDTWPGSMASPQTLNRYAYATGYPSTLTDPSGHCAVDTVFDAAFIAYDIFSLLFGPEKERETNQLALGADVAAAFIPCVAGAGIIVRVAARSAQGVAELTVRIGPKVARQMAKRGWTEPAIQEAIAAGKQVRAVNLATGNSATRYIHPTTGQSVVVDDITGEVIHVGGPGFKYGLGSGDLP